MSAQPDADAIAIPSTDDVGFAHPTFTQLLAILAVVVVTAGALVVIDHRFGPGVRPANTPSGWTPVYGEGFALSLPAAWDATTKESDLADAGIPDAVMAGGTNGSDPQYPDALAFVVSHPGTAAALASAIGGLGRGTPTTISAGEATMYRLASSELTGRAWLLDDNGTAWGIVVLVRNGSSYAVDDVAPKIANSFDIS
jgi:hypothetical protein